jgi:hypothetical protein
MTKRLIAPLVLTALASMLASSGAVAPGRTQLLAAAAQGRQQAGPQGPTPRLANGRVDLSGVWRPGDIFLIEDISLGLAKGETVPLNEWAKGVMTRQQSKDDPEANCLPTGVPRHAPYPWRIVGEPDLVNPARMYFLFEGNIHSYRQIFMDGRAHPADPNPTWYGHSVGRWDGDALVIDTVGFNDKFWFDFVGHPHTEKLHTIERYTRPDLGTLKEDITIEDPGAYTRPFTLHASHRLVPGDELMEYICQENQKDTGHLVGPAGRP